MLKAPDLPSREFELSTLLMAMRKLREGLIGSRRTDEIARDMYIFIIRATVYESSFEAYHPALLHLLNHIQLVSPLPAERIREFASYHVLDLACRLGALNDAYMARHVWKVKDKNVDMLLRALATDNWTLFWRAKAAMYPHQQRLVAWAAPRIRQHATRCLGRSYHTVEVEYVTACTGKTFDELKSAREISWEAEEGKVVVKRWKAK